MSRGGCSIDLGLWLVRPGLGRHQPLLELANRREILVELVPIGGADAAREALHLVLHGVHDALSLAELVDLLLHLGRRAIEEEPGKHARRAAFGGNHHAAAGVREARRAGAQHQRRKPRLQADLLGRQLVERDGILEARQAREPRRVNQLISEVWPLAPV